MVSQVGTVLERQNNPSEALTYYERSMGIDEKLAALDPTNAMSKSDLDWDRKAVARLQAQLKAATPQPKKP